MLKKMINNYSVVFATLINIIISFIYSLIVPNAIGVTSYGLFQYYAMLISFAGLFHFGIIWGYYLKYGGKNFDELNKSVFSSQFRVFFIGEVVISSIGIILSQLVIGDVDKRFVFAWFFVYIAISNIKQYVLYILLLSGKLKDYSIFIVLERVMFLMISLMIVLIKVKSFELFVLGDITVQVIVCLLLMLKYRDFTIKNFASYKIGINELFANMKLGFTITFSEVFGMMIISSFRIVTEAYWSIEMFSQISLSLAISNCVATIASSFSYVIFPNLRRQQLDDQKNTYIELRTVLIVLFSLTITFYPLFKKLIIFVLPKYGDAANYLLFFLPICFFTTKAFTVTGTFLKNMFMQKQLFFIELVTVIITFIVSIASAYLAHNIELSVILLLVIVMLKSSVSDIIISKKINVKYKESLLKEFFIAFLPVFLYKSPIPFAISFFTLLLLCLIVFYNEIFSFQRKVNLVYEKNHKDIT